MLGRDHALLGAVGYLAVAPVATHAAGVALSAPQLAIGAATCAGFALLPDIDEPHSTVSRKLGPISEAVSHVTNKLSGGHRHATHSLLFVAAVGLGCWAALAGSPWVAGGIVCAALLLSLRLILPLGVGRSGLVLGGAVVLACVWVVHDHDVRGWLPFAAAAGVLLHLVGDALTVEGVPLLWPIKAHVAVPLVGHTASLRERLVGTGLSIALVGLAWVHLGPALAASTNQLAHSHLPSTPAVHLPHVHLPHVHVPTTLPTLPHP